MDDKEKVSKALDLIFTYGGIDGSHHKDWLIDQLARTLTQEGYDDWVANYENGDEYTWETGVAP